MYFNTNISNVIDGNVYKNQYDTEVKRVLADKNILAWVMKFSVEEFQDYSIDVILECIEGKPEIGIHRVLPGHTPEAIVGMNTEDSVPGEGSITYDVRFYAVTPCGEHVKLIINVEAQKDYYPGYDLVTRGVFYCARLLSAQCGTEFVPRNYDDIKKVYSVWICMNTPKKVENTITRYRMRKEDVYGYVEDTARYDLLEVVMVCLGKEYINKNAKSTEEGCSLHGLLGTLLSEKLTPAKKKEILNKKYGIVTSVELEGGLNDMCNLSDLIEEHAIERGMKRGLEQGIEQGTFLVLNSLVVDGILSEEQAADRMNVSVERFRQLREVR